MEGSIPEDYQPSNTNFPNYRQRVIETDQKYYRQFSDIYTDVVDKNVKNASSAVV